jgi:hypothetical protein
VLSGLCNSYAPKARIHDSMKNCFAHWRQLATGLLLMIAVGCRPESKDMLVAYVQGDIFLPHLRAGIWNVGEGMECQIASRTSIPPDERGDLLLCGAKTQLAWSQTWLRPDIKNEIYGAAKKQTVKFHSAGHPGHDGRYSPRLWECSRTPERIDCD